MFPGTELWARYYDHRQAEGDLKTEERRQSRSLTSRKSVPAELGTGQRATSTEANTENREPLLGARMQERASQGRQDQKASGLQGTEPVGLGRTVRGMVRGVQREAPL